MAVIAGSGWNSESDLLRELGENGFGVEDTTAEVTVSKFDADCFGAARIVLKCRNEEIAVKVRDYLMKKTSMLGRCTNLESVGAYVNGDPLK